MDQTFDPMPADGSSGWGTWLRDVVDTLDVRAPRYHIMDSRYEGPSGAVGIGSAAADTYATNAMLADIMSGTAATNRKEKAAYYAGGHNYRINATVDWPAGVHKYVGPGADGVVGRKAQFLWDGAAGGKMFDCVNTGDRIQNQLVTGAVYREGTNRPNTFWEMGDETTNPVSGVDMGTMFYRVDFYNFDGDAVDLRFGPTNFFAVNWRADNYSGFPFRIAVNNAASKVTIRDFTIDNGFQSAQGGGGLVHLDGTGAGSNKTVSAHISDGKCEINTTMVGQKAVVLCTMDPTATQGIQHRVTLNNVDIVRGVGVTTDLAFVKARRTDDVATRMIYVTAKDCAFAPGATGNSRLIDGVTEPPSWGTYTGQIPTWAYTPQGFGFASPGVEAVFMDEQTQRRIRDLWVGLGDYSTLNAGRGLIHLHNALATPGSAPTAGGYLYSEAGALKWRGPTTTTTIAIA